MKRDARDNGRTVGNFLAGAICGATGITSATTKKNEVTVIKDERSNKNNKKNGRRR